MKNSLDNLLEILNEIIQLLESDGEQHWSRWMRQVHTQVSNSDYAGIEKLMSAYGGMGSFNDLVICQEYENGQFRWKEGHVEKNKKLSELRSQVWELAQFITRDHINSNS